MGERGGIAANSMLYSAKSKQEERAVKTAGIKGERRPVLTMRVPNVTPNLGGSEKRNTK